MAQKSPSIPDFIRQRCPDHTEEELQDAYGRFRAYLALAYRIWERQRFEPADSHESGAADRVVE